MKALPLLPLAFLMAAGGLRAQDDQAADDPTKVIATVRGKKITEDDKDRLQGRIFGVLFERFAKDAEIKVTKEEIAEYRHWQDETTERLHAGYEKERRELVKELQSNTLGEEERARKQEHLETLESILESHREQRRAQKGPLGLAKLATKHGMDKFYGDQIRRWKTNKALFDKYGGRILFQQFGMEPIDAYRDFLREQEEKGTFEILDKKYQDPFWAYFLHPAKVFVQPEEKAKEFFATPPWREKAEEDPSGE